MKHTGWRKPTPGLGIAEQLAQAGERVAVPKSQAFVAVKRVGAHIGLKAGDMLLLDTLGAFTQAQDWEEGASADRLGLQRLPDGTDRLLAVRAQAPCAAPGRDRGDFLQGQPPMASVGATGDADGRIIEAYGFDLSPLSARAEEFEQLQAELQAERELCQRLKRQITVARRMIRARIEAALSGALSGPWTHLVGLF